MIPRYLVPFDLGKLPVADTDVLIIGSGSAALRAAIEAARLRRRVLLVTKKARTDCNSFYAQGGIAAAIADHDTPEAHILDTLKVGCGLSDPAMVEIVVREGADRVRELLEWGAPFDRDGRRLSFGLEGGHSTARVLHRGDETGAMLERELLRHVRSPIVEECFALDLVTQGGACWGAVVAHPKKGLLWVRARRTILATGGLGQIYRETTNPPVATGDGVAMAWRAGAQLMDMEFMQFHPTTLYLAGASRALISEAVRGAGAKLRDRKGRAFMKDYHAMAELAPRDVVSRSILRHMLQTRDTQVYLDTRHIRGLAKEFPAFARLCHRFDLDPTKDLIPVRPAAHYMVGGVRTDEWGRTSIANLFACGEVAAAGFHGANRLASNSLLECLVFGRRAGSVAAQEAHAASPRITLRSPRRRLFGTELDLEDIRNSLRNVMWFKVGIERDREGLQYAIDSIDLWSRYVLDRVFDEPGGWELQNMLALGGLMARAALRRQESRGVHFRRDFPKTDDRRWRSHLVLRGNGVKFNHYRLEASEWPKPTAGR
ncbi:MAG TPA: L-aspartate oxidase [Planctomycetota bacterium]|nr:L-aspartate oxidase [Planctomycetota bacterium]